MIYTVQNISSSETRTPSLPKMLLSKNRAFFMPFYDVCLMSQTALDELNGELQGSVLAPGVVLRSGEPLDPDHLMRGNFRRAGVIILPADRMAEGEAEQDARNIALAMTMGHLLSGADHKPLLVAEMQNPERAKLLTRLYPGKTVVLTADRILSECAVQCIHQPGVSSLLIEILNQSSPVGLYLKMDHGCGGLTVEQVISNYPSGVVIGLLRVDPISGAERAVLCPDDQTIVEQNDSIIFLAKGLNSLKKNMVRDVKALASSKGDMTAKSGGLKLLPVESEIQEQRILITGWNRRTIYLIKTLLDTGVAASNIMNLSTFSMVKREKAFRDINPSKEKIEWIEGDSTHPASWAKLDGRYDVVVIQSSEKFLEAMDADAAILSVLALAQTVGGHHPKIRYLAEIVEFDLGVLLGMGQQVEPLPTTQFMAHMLAQSSMRPELAHVYESIFDSKAFRLSLRPMSVFKQDRLVKFSELSDRFCHKGERLLGVIRNESREFVLADRLSTIPLRTNDELLLLRAMEGE